MLRRQWESEEGFKAEIICCEASTRGAVGALWQHLRWTSMASLQGMAAVRMATNSREH